MIISSLTRRAHIAGFLLICPSLTFATTIDWTLNATTLDSGSGLASVTGTFTYDNILHEYSNVNLTYTGEPLFDFTATSAVFESPNAVLVNGPILGNNNIQTAFFLLFGSSLDLASAGDTIAVCGGIDTGIGSINDPRPECGTRHSVVQGITDLTNENIQEQYFNGAGVITSAVPIPATVWLFGSGLLGLIGVARRKVRV